VSGFSFVERHRPERAHRRDAIAERADQLVGEIERLDAAGAVIAQRAGLRLFVR
jgi:hypothetical protein